MIRIRNVLPIIRIHPVLILFILLALLTGTFVQLFIMLCIVLIHECGHFFAARLLKWRVNHISLWIFGGVMKTDEYSYGKVWHDVIVTIAGPAQHLFIYLILMLLSPLSLFPASLIELAFFYNSVILIFNLLPIYPLDGGKLLFSILTLFIPYRSAYRYTLLFSMIALTLIVLLHLFLLPFTLSALLLIVFLLFENVQEWRNQHYIFIRFLLNRLESHPYKNVRYNLFVKSKQSLMTIFARYRRNKYHYLILDEKSHSKTLSEHMALTLYFQKYKYKESIGELMD